jgi:hypothetical protein
MSAETPRTEGNPVRFLVEEGAVRQFRLAAQTADKRTDDTVPWTFPMAVAHWLSPEDKVDTGFDRARLLHGGQEFVYPDGPLEPGSELIAQESIVDRFEKRGSRGGLMKFVVVETTFRDAGNGKVAAYMRRTVIEREGAPS